MRLNTPLPVLLTSILVVIIGAALAGMGGWLVALGGSPYYVVAGLGLLISGVLIGRQRQLGAWVYTIVLAGTVIWAIWEVGLDGWSLIPRLVAPAVLGIWVWSPWIVGRLGPDRGRGWRWANGGFSAIVLVLVFAAGYRITEARYLSFAPPSGWENKGVQTEPAVPDDTWSCYGRTPAADRHSPLSQITAANVSQLKQAWSFSTGDLPRPGALSWAWDMGRSPANAPLEKDDIYTRGTPNGSGVYSADPKLNLVFVPLGNATPDYYGAERRSFDFDVPVGPSLVDLPGQDGGAPVPALVQTTKQGEIYLLDRRDGKPISPVEERAVPQGDIPNERYSKTQPFSVGMPALRAPKFQEIDTWGATPIDQLICRIQYRQMRDDGLYTPPGLKPTLGWPAFDGTSDWYGSTIDPVRKLMYINTTFMPFRLQMIPYEKGLRKGLYKPWAGWGQPYPQSEFSNNPQHGTPFAITVDAWLNLLNLPCSHPPWGQMQAIDLLTHKVVWQRPLGATRNMGPLGLRIPFGLPTGIFSMGGSVTTASGLVFIGATTDQNIRALDGRTGKTLWQADLPAGGNATPLTYLGKDGRQYVVIAAGGHGGLQSRNGDEILAFALPNMP